MNKYTEEITKLFAVGYEEILRADLMDESFVSIKRDGDNLNFEKISSDSIDDWFKDVSESKNIFIADKEKFLNITKISNIRKCYKHNDNFLTHEYRRVLGESNIVWETLHIFIVDEGGSPVCYYCIRSSHDDEVILHDAIDILVDSFRKIIKLDLTNQRYEVFSFGQTDEKRFASGFYDESGNFRDILDAGRVHPEDFNTYSPRICEKYLSQFFCENDRMYFRFRYRVDGKYRWHAATITKSAEYKENNQVIIVYIRDIHTDYSNDQEYKIKLEHALYHDSMTGLWNRKKLTEMEDKIAAGLVEKPKKVGIVLVDVNGLKYINDNYGHSEGDKTIRLTVDAMRGYFEEGKLFRISGDEFIVLDTERERKDFLETSANLKKAFGENGDAIAACGYIWTDEYISMDSVIKKADALMYIDKERYYSSSGTPTKKYSSTFLSQLITLLEQGRYIVYFQPKAKFSTGEIYGAEALVRYINEEGKIITPAVFISEMEKNLTISHLDYFVFEKVCAWLEKWNKSGNRRMHISTNFSRITFSEPDFVENLEKIRARYMVDAHQISLEITESVESISQIRLMEFTTELKKIGYVIELDDYGKDFSSLSMFTFDAIDIIKVDRSLVLDMQKSEKSRIIMAQLCRMCHSVDLECLVEGIETEDVYNQIRDMGYDYVQGYYIGKPMPIDEFEEKYLK